jgi:carbonic anhydrase
MAPLQDGKLLPKGHVLPEQIATNVGLAVAAIHRRSPVLEDLSKKGTIAIVGAMYDLATGTAKFRAT